MNKENRKQLQEAIDLLLNAQTIIEEIKDNEQEKFDNLSDGLQQSEKGERFENIVSSLEYAFDNIDEAIQNVTEAMD